MYCIARSRRGFVSAIYLLAGACGSGATSRPRDLQFQALPPLATATHPSAIAAVDLDGDGDLDLVVPGVMSSEISIFVNDGGQLHELRRVAVAGGPLSVAAGDFDGDGHPDLA